MAQGTVLYHRLKVAWVKGNNLVTSARRSIKPLILRKLQECWTISKAELACLTKVIKKFVNRGTITPIVLTLPFRASRGLKEMSLKSRNRGKNGHQYG